MPAERDSFNLNDERYLQLKKLYDERVNSLYNNIKSIAGKFEGDEILNTMKHDSISNEFITQRVKEIIDINLTKEKEEILKKLIEELAEAKARVSQKEQVITELKTNHKATLEDYERKMQHLEGMINNESQNSKQLENKVKSLHYEVETNEMQMRSNSEDLLNKNSHLSVEFHKLKKDYQHAIDHIKVSIKINKKYDDIDKENDSFKMENERLKKVISVLEIDNHHTDQKLKDKQVKNESLHEEITVMKNHVFEGNLQNKKLLEENKGLALLIEKYENERKRILENYNNMTNENEKV